MTFHFPIGPFAACVITSIAGAPVTCVGWLGTDMCTANVVANWTSITSEVVGCLTQMATPLALVSVALAQSGVLHHQPPAEVMILRNLVPSVDGFLDFAPDLARLFDLRRETA